MIVPDVLMVHHILEIADDPGGPKVVPAGRDERLVHVQRDGERAVGPLEVDPALRQIEGPFAAHHPGDLLLRPAHIGQYVDIVRQRN